MASEIIASASLTFSKAGAGAAGVYSSGSFTFTGTAYFKGKQNVGTSEEALLLGDVTPGGWALIRNLDATNFVAIKSGTGVVPLVRINAGEFALFRVSSLATAPFIQADTSSVNVEILLLAN